MSGRLLQGSDVDSPALHADVLKIMQLESLPASFGRLMRHQRRQIPAVSWLC
jgi:hypothetical protein